jgi:hypothetical protein
VRPETGEFAADFFLRVSGDGHQGISPSGVSRSAFSRRLRVPAADGQDADPDPEPVPEYLNLAPDG